MITLTNILNETSRAVLKVIQGPLAGFSYKSWSVRVQLMYESNPRVPMPPPPGLTPGHLTLFLVKFPTMHAGLFFGQMPLSQGRSQTRNLRGEGGGGYFLGEQNFRS